MKKWPAPALPALTATVAAVLMVTVGAAPQVRAQAPAATAASGPAPFTPALARPPAGLADAAPAGRAAVEPRVERIRHEDQGSRIDEWRVGGQTESITVQPRNGLPAWQVRPVPGAQAERRGGERGLGERTWRVLDF